MTCASLKLSESEHLLTPWLEGLAASFSNSNIFFGEKIIPYKLSLIYAVLHIRFSLPGDKATLPGPGAYIPEKVSKATQGIFFF